MEYIQTIIDYLLHLDVYLFSFINTYGAWAYPLLFLIIFCETGLVVTPFLPGDSLLFVAGSLAAQNAVPLNIISLFLLLLIASIAGNELNYLIGKKLGNTVFKKDFIFFKRKYVDQAHTFYKTYGGKTIILARFLPIIRTFAPFVAGIAAMNHYQFLLYNLFSAMLWIGSLLCLGYLLGSLPFIKNNFTLVIYGIIVLSILPSIITISYKRLRTALRTAE